MSRFFKKLMGFRADERGYSSVEFVIVATTFLTGFFWIFETGLIMTKKMMLERSLDMVVREMRLSATPASKLPNETMYDWAKDEICDLALVLKDCQNNLYLEMSTFNPSVGYGKNFKCVNREDTSVNPLAGFTVGGRSEIVYMRACVLIDPMMPNGIALFPGVSGKGIPLIADTAFMNEPE